MKRFLSLCLAALLLFSLTACTNTPSEGGTTTAVTTTTTASTVTTVTENGDPSETTTSATQTTAVSGETTVTTLVSQTETTVLTTQGTTVIPTVPATTTTTAAPTTVTTAVPTTVTTTTATTTTVLVTTTTVTTTRPTVTQPNVTRVISCWGDSITEGMNMGDTERYPYVLNTLLGSNYIVQNSGDGGEDTLTIMARQGAAPVYVENAVSFAAGETRALISSRGSQGLVTTGNVTLKLRPQLGRDLSINDVIIDGATYTVSLENYNANLKTYDVYLTRKSGTAALTIPAGTSVKFASVNAAKTNYCDVYLMGANGGWNDDVNTLVSHFQSMIDYRGNDNYIVVIPYWRTDCTDAFKTAFGDKAINLVDYAKTKGLTALNITPSQEDRKAMSRGYLPMCLTLNGTSVKTDVHLNSKGYRMLATAVYETGRDLGYWN